MARCYAVQKTNTQTVGVGNQLLRMTLALKLATRTKKKRVGNWKDCARTLVLEASCKVKSLLPIHRWEMSHREAGIGQSYTCRNSGAGT